MPSNFKKILISQDDDIRGIVHYHYEFYSRYLKNERDIIVWLPYSYQSERKNYPVLYMHDGQNLFNPSTSFIGYDWKVDETVSDLIESSKIEEIIVVAIYNTKDRLEEFNLFTTKGMHYASFIINELIPFIEENYPVIKDYTNTAVMGSSMGGLCSFQMIWKYPNIFGKAACMSNSFWVNDKEIFKMIESGAENVKGNIIYLDCGDKESELLDDSILMINELKNLGFKENKNLFWHIEEGGTHSEIDWCKRLFIPLEVMFGK